MILLAVVHGFLAFSFYVAVAGSFRSALFWAVPLVLTTIGFYHTIEFPKLTFALSLIPWWAAKARLHSFIPFVAALAVFLAALIHPATLVIGLAVAAILFFRHSPSQFRANSYLSISVALLIGCVVIFFFRHSFIRLESFEWGPPGIWTLATRGNLPFFLKFFSVSLVLSLTIVGIFRLRSRKYLEAACLLTAALSSFLPTTREAMFGLGERMTVLTGLVALPLLGTLENKKTTPTSGKNDLVSALFGGLLLAALTGGAGGLILRHQIPTFPYAEYEKISDFVSSAKPKMLIATRPLKFYYTARTGRDAFLFDPDPDWIKEKIWRVVFDVRLEELIFFIQNEKETDLIIPVPMTSALYVREDLWESIRSRVSHSETPGLFERVWENERNPSKQRPDYLRKRARLGEHHEE